LKAEHNDLVSCLLFAAVAAVFVGQKMPGIDGQRLDGSQRTTKKPRLFDKFQPSV
jgi:hypothetical protein